MRPLEVLSLGCNVHRFEGSKLPVPSDRCVCPVGRELQGFLVFGAQTPSDDTAWCLPQ